MFENYSWTKVSRRRNMLTSIYEPIQIDLLRGLARKLPGCNFIDIGANIGAYAIFIGGEKFVERVYAFEPVPSIADELYKNIKLNNLESKISLHRVVLSDSEGSANFVVRSDFAGDGGVLETHMFTHLPYKNIERFEKKTLDQIVNLTESQVVIKIDVEGHELSVLQGAKRVLKENNGFIQIEFLTPQQESLGEDLLRSMGWFKMFKVDRDVYFSNVMDINNPETRLSILEDCLAQFVNRTRAAEGAPARKEIISGVVLELSGGFSRSAKRFLKFIRDMR